MSRRPAADLQGVAARAAAAGDQGHPRGTLATSILATSLAFIDGSVVNVALPAIGHSLDAGAAELQWTINAYLLPLSALLLLGGAAGDHFGRRRMLMWGIALFALASVGCALAPEINTLLAARALQGVGAAMLMPNSLAVLGHAFEGQARGKAIGTWAAAGAIASAAGPPLGGWLVESIGWRAIFFLNLPVAAAALGLAWHYVGESGKGTASLDRLGALLATLALGTLTWSLTRWSAGRSANLEVWATLLLGLLLLSAFLWHEHRRGDRAMMPLSMFASRPFLGVTFVTFGVYAALGGLLVLLPYALITGGYSPFHAGLAILPFPIVMGCSGRFMGSLAGRFGARWPLTIGPFVTGLGFLLLLRVDPQASYWSSVLPAMLVIALGMSGTAAPLTTAVLASVDDRHTGTASGFNSAIARTGGLIATALSGAVIAASGAALLSAFHVAAIIGAALAMLSALTALVTLKGEPAR